MDIRRLVRDAKRVNETLHHAADDTIVTSRGCKILIPERYTEKGLAEISAETSILGIFAIIVDDMYYAVSNVIAMMRVTPSVIATVKIDGSNYLELTFAPGSVVIADSQLVKNKHLVSKVFDEFISKGRVPWFLDYVKDMGSLFDSSDYHAGLDMSKQHAVLEIITAAITRKASDPTVYYRQSVTTPADLSKVEPTFIPLRSISYGTTNTLTRLVGSYFVDGLTSALVNPSTNNETIETVLRM